MSTTTLHQAVNLVLRTIGERQSASIYTKTAAKVVDALRDVSCQMLTVTDWRFTLKRVSASSWLGEAATLPEFQRVERVTYNDGTRKKPLTPVDERQFYEGAIDVGTPMVWAVTGDNEVSVEPYPNTEEEQDKLEFTIVAEPEFPTEPTQVFNFPERYVSVLVMGACSQFVMAQLEDTERAKYYQSRYETLLAPLVQRERANKQGRNHSFFNHLKRRA